MSSWVNIFGTHKEHRANIHCYFKQFNCFAFISLQEFIWNLKWIVKRKMPEETKMKWTKPIYAFSQTKTWTIQQVFFAEKYKIHWQILIVWCLKWKQAQMLNESWHKFNKLRQLSNVSCSKSKLCIFVAESILISWTFIFAQIFAFIDIYKRFKNAFNEQGCLGSMVRNTLT